MNNADFRRIVTATPRRVQDGSPGGGSRPRQGSSSLGPRTQSAVPMTPRTLKATPPTDFARQAAEQVGGDQRAKKFRSSAAPKGAKLAAGYTDRTATRREEAVLEDEKEARIKALEEQMKLGQIERETFEKLRDEITAGDIGATHLVKGLDRRLLERIRRGEDVLSGESQENASDEPAVNADEELEKLEQQDITPVQHEQKIKKGEMAPPLQPTAGVKRSRNDILAELKASRKAAAEAKAAAPSQLGSRFRAFGGPSVQTRIEKDEKGREVLITVDENGRVKRKVRKVDTGSSKPPNDPTTLPDKVQKPLGMEVPAQAPAISLEPEDDDIFEGVGDTYDPLGTAEDDPDGASSSDEGESEARTTHTALEDTRHNDTGSQEPSNLPDATSTDDQPRKRNNYFNDTADSAQPTTQPDAKPFEDPTILAAIKRAAALNPQADESSRADEDDSRGASGDTTKSRILAQRDRDLDDMEYRSDDDEDDGKVKLSQWKGTGGAGECEDEGGEGRKDRGGAKRKRGKKKKKIGDKNNASDVLKVLEGRRGGG